MKSDDWTSVDDGVPPKGAKPVQVYNGYDVVAGRYYRDWRGWRSEPDCPYFDNDITHWMPLPDPPDKETR